MNDEAFELEGVGWPQDEDVEDELVAKLEVVRGCPADC